MVTESNAVTNSDESQRSAQSQETNEESTQARTPEEEQQAAITKAVREATGKQGREHKLILSTVTKERDDFKSRAEAAESKIESIEDERKSLREQIDDLTSDDPRKFDLVKRDRQLRDRETKLKADLQAEETKRKSYEARIAKAAEFETKMMVFDIAAEYENPEPDKLEEKVKEFEEKLGVKLTNEDQIRSVAEILWGESEGTKPPKKKPMKTDSGRTDGGGSESLESLMKKNVKNMTYQEKLEHQKKLNEARKALTRT